jgi:hypothetical protein
MHFHGVANDLAAILGQLKVWPLFVHSIASVLHSILQKAKSQQGLSQCLPFPLVLTLGGVTYEFRDCVGKIMQWKYTLVYWMTVSLCTVMGPCVSTKSSGTSSNMRTIITYINFLCYDIHWFTNGNGVQNFKLCPNGEYIITMTVHCIDLAKPIIVAAGGTCIKNFGLMRCGASSAARC